MIMKKIFQHRHCHLPPSHPSHHHHQLQNNQSKSSSSSSSNNKDRWLTDKNVKTYCRSDGRFIRIKTGQTVIQAGRQAVIHPYIHTAGRTYRQTEDKNRPHKLVILAYIIQRTTNTVFCNCWTYSTLLPASLLVWFLCVDGNIALVIRSWILHLSSDHG